MNTHQAYAIWGWLQFISFASFYFSVAMKICVAHRYFYLTVLSQTLFFPNLLSSPYLVPQL